MSPAPSTTAAATLAVVCADALLDHAEGFTCDEAEAVAGFLRHWHPEGGELAESFMTAHAEGDHGQHASVSA